MDMEPQNPSTGQPARDRTAAHAESSVLVEKVVIVYSRRWRRPLSGEETTRRLDSPWTTTARQPPTPDPVHLNFTLQPTEEDLKNMQICQDKNGRIKRPLNAYIVWSTIHRGPYRKAFPNVRPKDISIELGKVWSKLSQEQKKPYYEMAEKLKAIHRKQFPGYVYLPLKKKGRENLTSGQGNGQEGEQGAGQRERNLLRQGEGHVMRQGEGQEGEQGAGQRERNLMRQGEGQEEGHIMRQGAVHVMGQGEGHIMRQGAGQVEGHVMRQEEGHVMRQEEGHVMRQEEGHVMRQEEGQGEGHVMRQEEGHVIRQEGHVMRQVEGHVMRQGEGHEIRLRERHVMRQGERRVMRQRERHVMRQGEGHVMRQVEGHVVRQGEGHVMRQRERHVMRQGEGHVMRQGEGHVMRQGEGHVMSQGEGQVEGHVMRQGEGHVMRQGEGHVMRQGEGHVMSQGEGQVEGYVMRQGAGHSRGVSYLALHARPPAQLLDARMYPYLSMMPQRVVSHYGALGYYSYPFIQPYPSLDLYSRNQIQFSRFQNTSSSIWCMRNGPNLQMEGATLAAHTRGWINQECRPAEHHHEVLINPATPLNIEPHNTVTQQLSANNGMEQECEDDIDVVGLF